MERVAAWLVHAYTTTGVVLALLMVHFSYQGEVAHRAVAVPRRDGRRRHRRDAGAPAGGSRRSCPQFDGALLDNIVDYITYAFAPMVLLWATGYLPDDPWGGVVAALPLVASCFQFCRTDAKTDDHFFLGFPSYWNIVAFYVVVFEPRQVATTAVLLWR